MKTITMLVLAHTFGAMMAVELLMTPVASLAGPSTADREPQRTVEQKFDAFNRHDADAIQDLYATDAMLRSPDYPELPGNAKIADTYRWIFAAIPDAKDTVSSIESIGNNVYVQFVLSGHLKDAQSKPVSIRIMSVYTVKDHHIVSDATYYDRKSS